MRSDDEGTDAAGIVMVVGAGLMGVGIAVVFSLAGYPVILIESKPDRRDLARSFRPE